MNTQNYLPGAEVTFVVDMVPPDIIFILFFNCETYFNYIPDYVQENFLHH